MTPGARPKEAPVFIRPAEHLPYEDDWFALTESARKRAAYTDDLYFRECWVDIVDILGDRRRMVLDRLAMFAFKADGVAGRRLRPTMEYFARHGFRTVGVKPFQHNRQSMRAVWQYDWHVYPAERLSLCSLMHAATESLLLLLVDDRYDGVVPGTMRLSELKGSSDAKARTPEQLRSVLLPPNRVINFVHVADEPADIVREIGIFFERENRRRLFEQVSVHFADDLADLAYAEINRLEQTYPASDFDLAAAYTRLVARGVSTREIGRLQEADRSGQRLTWDELAAIVDPTVDVWDFVRIATEVLPMQRPGLTGTMEAPTSSDWTARSKATRG